MAPGSMTAPKRRSGSAVASANAWMYGPNKAVTTVVLKAELAQSYIIQPVISRLLFNGPSWGQCDSEVSRSVGQFGRLRNYALVIGKGQLLRGSATASET